MNKPNKGKKLFCEGYNCAQSVLGAYCEELRLEKDTALRMVTGLGSGVRCGEACGAVTGAVLVIGLTHGYGCDKNMKMRIHTNDLVAQFHKKFKQKHKSILCKDILGYDLSKEDQLKIIREKALFDTICPNIVESACEILDEIL